MTVKLKQLICLAWLRNAGPANLAGLYLITLALFLVSGMLAALVMQLELWSNSSRLIGPGRFGQFLTHHGLVMMFVILLPLIPAVLGNLIVPRAVGSKSVAFMRLSRLAWVIHLFGGIGVILSVELEAYDGGWTLLMPGQSPLYGLLVASLLLVALATLVMHLSIAGTIISKKYRISSFSTLPVVAWLFLVGSLVMLVVSPIRCWSLVIQGLQHLRAGLAPIAADPDAVIAYQRLFWGYVAPATYAVVLAAIGIMLEILAAHSSKGVYARRAVIVAAIVLGQLSLVAWGRHLLTAAGSETIALAGSLFGLLTAIPMLVLMLSWMVMLVRARSHAAMPVLVAWLQAALIALGGMVGIALAIPSVGISLHDSYFTTGHLHLISVGGVLLACLAGLFHWQPLPAGRSTNLARYALAGMATGIFLTYVPMLLNGLGGLPKALYVYPEQFTPMHAVSTAGTFVLFAAVILLIGLFGQAAIGRRSGPLVQPASHGEVNFEEIAAITVRQP